MRVRCRRANSSHWLLHSHDDPEPAACDLVQRGLTWDEYADFVDERGATVGAAMLAAADLQPGDEVLELGCGPGGVGFAAAESWDHEVRSCCPTWCPR